MAASMQRRHFELIADILNDGYRTAHNKLETVGQSDLFKAAEAQAECALIESMINKFTVELRSTNGGFKTETFRARCLNLDGSFNKPRGGRREPKYLRNVCPVCHEPMLGTHYHDTND